MLREILFISTTWNLLVIISVQDVKTAFDSMPHGLIAKSMIGRGIAKRDVALHMRELHDMRGRITLPAVGTTESFVFYKEGNKVGSKRQTSGAYCSTMFWNLWRRPEFTVVWDSASPMANAMVGNSLIISFGRTILCCWR